MTENNPVVPANSGNDAREGNGPAVPIPAPGVGAGAPGRMAGILLEAAAPGAGAPAAADPPAVAARPVWINWAAPPGVANQPEPADAENQQVSIQPNRTKESQSKLTVYFSRIPRAVKYTSRPRKSGRESNPSNQNSRLTAPVDTVNRHNPKRKRCVSPNGIENSNSPPIPESHSKIDTPFKRPRLGHITDKLDINNLSNLLDLDTESDIADPVQAGSMPSGQYPRDTDTDIDSVTQHNTNNSSYQDKLSHNIECLSAMINNAIYDNQSRNDTENETLVKSTYADIVRENMKPNPNDSLSSIQGFAEMWSTRGNKAATTQTRVARIR